eukprot:1363608-Rhodomonas_salina.1
MCSRRSAWSEDASEQQKVPACVRVGGEESATEERKGECLVGLTHIAVGSSWALGASPTAESNKRNHI